MLSKILNYSTWGATLIIFISAVGLLVIATPLFGNKALIVRSGSMTPAINVGDVVVVRAQEQPYEVGQAISYKLPDHQNMVVTHRITDASAGVYRTKGDANNEVDGYVVKPDQILGREIFVVPYVGTLLAFAKTKLGFVLLVIVPALAVILGEGITIFREMRPKRTREPEPQPALIIDDQEIPLPADAIFPSAWVTRPLRRPLLMDSLSRRLIIFLAALAIMTPATWAQYSDTGTSTNNILTAAADFGGPSPTPTPSPTLTPTPTPSVTPSPSPSPTPGAGDVVINEVMWMGSTTQAIDEWLELRNTTSSPIILTGWQIINAGAGSSHIILSGTIPANGFFLISNFEPDHPQSALNDALTTDAEANVSFVDGGEQLTLQNASAAIIDRTPAGSGWAAGDDDPLHQSMSRNSTPGDGTIGSNWHTCTDTACNDGTYWDTVDGNNYGTPKATNL